VDLIKQIYATFDVLAFVNIRFIVFWVMTPCSLVIFTDDFKNKNISKKLKLILKNTIIDKTLTYALETSTLTKRDRKQLNIFETKVYRRILGPIYDNEKENWRILTNEEIYANIKKTYYNRDNKAA